MRVMCHEFFKGIYTAYTCCKSHVKLNNKTIQINIIPCDPQASLLLYKPSHKMDKCITVVRYMWYELFT